ncbi:fimbria/pilus outer membrane usher protein [Geminicoccaceae bacterium 1502E]|nr:fimbria/pilus outer membrane usher protein [Geminicoccaceae bacterium 1502E]
MARSISSCLLRAASLAGLLGLAVGWGALRPAGGESLPRQLAPATDSSRASFLLWLIAGARRPAPGEAEGPVPPPPRPMPRALIAQEPPISLPPPPAPPAGPADAADTTPAPVKPGPAASRPKLGRVVLANGAPPPFHSPFVRRRDRVEPPLLPEDGWQVLLFAVTLNGEMVDGKGTVALREPESGRLALPVPRLRAWNVRIDPAAVLTFEGEPFYPLDAIPGATVEADLDHAALALGLPAGAFARTVMGAEAAPRPQAARGTGGFLDYDLLLSGGQELDTRLDALAELGVFGAAGVATTSVRMGDLAGEDAELVRLESRWVKDMPERRSSLRLGDSLTTGGAFASPVRFGGLQWATDFATDPSFVTFPLPSIGGLAEESSIVDVYIDNLRQAGGEVPPGPFSFENLPVVTGAGEVQLKVRDLLGRERIVTRPYYVSTRLLKEGLHDYSYELGFERRAYGLESFDYGDALAAGTHRLGLSETATVEAHGELQPERVSLAGGGALRVGLLGVLSGGLGASAEDQARTGAMAQLAWEHNGRRLNLGLRTRWTSAGFRQLGLDDGRTARVDQASLGVDIGRAGRLGLLLLNEERHEGADRRSAGASWSVPVGPGSLLLNAGQSLEPERDLALTASYVIPLGPHRTGVIEGRSRDDRRTARLQFRQTRGASDLGLDYRVAVEAGDDPRTLDTRFSYQTAHGAAELELARFDDATAMRAGLGGSLALLDGKLAASRRIGSAFGMVDLPELPGVRVYLENREAGRTDEAGRLLLPGLRPWEENRVRVAVEDLPLDAVVTRPETSAVPFARSGVPVPFEVERRQQATARLGDAAGEALPPGLVLVDGAGAVEVQVGRDGFAAITGPLAAPVMVAGAAAGRRWRCLLPASAADELVPDLGDLRCE